MWSLTSSSTPASERDLPMISLRLVALWSGFYVISCVALEGLGVAFQFIRQHDSNRSRAMVTEVGSIRNGFCTVTSVFWMGLMLPSVWWMLLQRTIVILLFSSLVCVVVDSLRSVVDYVVSVYALHVVVTMLCIQVPKQAAWWAVVAVECILVAVISEAVVAKKQRSAMSRLVRNIERSSPREVDNP